MKISGATIERLQPIIDKIDEQLKLDQDERTDFQVYTSNVNALKNSLAHYKSLFKREEWNGRFWMTKKKDKQQGEYLDISFSPNKKYEIKIIQKQDGSTEVATSEATEYVIQSATPLPGDGPAREMNDNQASQFILMERPDSAVFLRSFLSPTTTAWLDNMKTADPSALINLLIRSGYRVANIHGDRMRIYK